MFVYAVASYSHLCNYTLYMILLHAYIVRQNTRGIHILVPMQACTKLHAQNHPLAIKLRNIHTLSIVDLLVISVSWSHSTNHSSSLSKIKPAAHKLSYCNNLLPLYIIILL